MMNIMETWFCICLIAIVTGKNMGHMEPYSDDNSAETMADINKRSWNMLRLGRGLQMLRLGKRSAGQAPLMRRARSLSDSENGKLSASEMQAVLASIFDSPRDESRRQPPLPRYGRDGSSTRDLLDAVSADDSGAFPLEFFPVSNTRLFFRPAPRGGRYRRSLPDGRITFGDLFVQDGADSVKAIPLSSFGRPRELVAHVQPKEQNSQSDSSKIQTV